MIIHKDFEELFRILNKRNVDYVIVGGYAVAFHGYVRATKTLMCSSGTHPEYRSAHFCPI